MRPIFESSFGFNLYIVNKMSRDVRECNYFNAYQDGNNENQP